MGGLNINANNRVNIFIFPKVNLFLALLNGGAAAGPIFLLMMMKMMMARMRRMPATMMPTTSPVLRLEVEDLEVVVVEDGKGFC